MKTRKILFFGALIVLLASSLTMNPWSKNKVASKLPPSNLSMSTTPAKSVTQNQDFEEKKSPLPSPSDSSTKVEPAKTYTISDDVKETGHYKLFPTMVAIGPSVKNPDGEHYGDGCLRCHSAIKILDDKTAKLDDFFEGGKYAGNVEGITCRVCHTFDNGDVEGLRNSGWEACGVCHINSNGDPQEGNEVHHPQFQMIKGVALGSIPNTPSYKYKYMKDTFSCVDCHVTNGQKHNFMVPGVSAQHSPDGIKRLGTTINYDEFKSIFKQKKCAVCHPNPNVSTNTIKKAQQDISTTLEKLRPFYEEWSKKIESLDKNDPRITLFQNGATYYTFVKADASNGAHNYQYAKMLLLKAEEYWKSILELPSLTTK